MLLPTTKTKRTLGCIHRDITNRIRCDHPTLLSTCQAASGALGSFLVPTIKERHGWTGEGPKKDDKDVQRAREPVL